MFLQRANQSWTCASLALVLLVLPARAQDEVDPEFVFEEETGAEEAVTTLQLSGGFLLLGGNSNVLTFTGGGSFSWADAHNRLMFDAAGAYAQSQHLVAVDYNQDLQIQLREITTISTVSASNVLLQGRYDRIFAPRNSLYVSANWGFDTPAGLDFVSGGQLGYSFELLKTDLHHVVVEAGYDLRMESYLPPNDAESTTLHSVRLFSAYVLTLAEDITASTQLEALSNVNPTRSPVGEIKPLADTRLQWRAGLSAKVWNNISARFGFRLRYDFAPAPRPPFDLPYADGLVVPAQRLDTQTEVSLVASFL